MHVLEKNKNNVYCDSRFLYVYIHTGMCMTSKELLVFSYTTMSFAQKETNLVSFSYENVSVAREGCSGVRRAAIGEHCPSPASAAAGQHCPRTGLLDFHPASKKQLLLAG